MFAVSYINWYDNELIVEFHDGPDWKAALAKHSKVNQSPFGPDGVPIPDDTKDMKQLCFDCDCMMEVVEVPKQV